MQVLRSKGSLNLPRAKGCISVSGETNKNRTVTLHGGAFLKKRKTSGASAGTPPTPPPADSEISPTLCNFRL